MSGDENTTMTKCSNCGTPLNYFVGIDGATKAVCSSCGRWNSEVLPPPQIVVGMPPNKAEPDVRFEAIERRLYELERQVRALKYRP